MQGSSSHHVTISFGFQSTKSSWYGISNPLLPCSLSKRLSCACTAAISRQHSCPSRVRLRRQLTAVHPHPPSDKICGFQYFWGPTSRWAIFRSTMRLIPLRFPNLRQRMCGSAPSHEFLCANNTTAQRLRCKRLCRHACARERLTSMQM